MKYDFDEITPRTGTYSVKWDASADRDVLPMWVADMDFKTAPAVVDALVKRAQHGIYGYTRVPDGYYNAVIRWFERRHNWKLSKDWILYTTGVVPALSAIIKALAEPGDGVILQTPVYNCFFSCVRNNGCEIVSNPLVYQNNTYRMDFEDLEIKAADPKNKLLVLCNPHNPAGRVWTAEELKRLGEICLKHNVLVVSDEIHCELVMPGHTYTPYGSLSKDFLLHSVTCASPSKAFNLAGLQTANIFAADETVRKKIDKALNVNEVCDIGPFGVEGLMAAYNNGEEWLEELNRYLYDNYLYLKDFFAKHLPRFPVTELEGTYLVWVNCSVLKRPSAEIAETLQSKGKVRVNAGGAYGKEGDGFIRINIACPRRLLQDGLNRLKQTLQTLL